MNLLQQFFIFIESCDNVTLRNTSSFFSHIQCSTGMPITVVSETMFPPQPISQFMSTLNHCFAKCRVLSPCVEQWTCKGQAIQIYSFSCLRTTGWSHLIAPGLNRVIWERDWAVFHRRCEDSYGTQIEILIGLPVYNHSSVVSNLPLGFLFWFTSFLETVGFPQNFPYPLLHD